MAKPAGSAETETHRNCVKPPGFWQAARARRKAGQVVRSVGTGPELLKALDLEGIDSTDPAQVRAAVEKIIHEWSLARLCRK